jgi:hypothetical protein
MEKDNLRQGQVNQYLKSLGCKLIDAEYDLQRGAREDRFDKDTVRHGDDDDEEKTGEKPEKRAVMVDISGAVILNTEYEADTKVHQGRELNMYKKPETRDVMNDITDAVMLNTEYEAGIKVHRGREFNMYEKPEARDGMLRTNPEGKHDEANEVRKRGNMRQEQLDQFNMYEKPETRAGMVDIIDAVMLNTEYEAGVKVHKGREINMYEKPEMRDGMLKTKSKGTRT